MPTPTHVIYLDHAATSWPKPKEVAEWTLRALTQLTANAGRSGHRAALDSARLVFDTRCRLSDLLGVERSENLIFVRGCTEGINLVLKGYLRPGDHVLVSPLEHNAVMRPLSRLARERSLVVESLPAGPLGRLDPDAVRRFVADRPLAPALVVVQHASNVTGLIQDVAAIKRALGETPILVDAAQTAGVLPIAVSQWGVDFLATSVHKGLLGPTGVGVVYVSPDWDVDPLVEGGTGSRSESAEQPVFRPDCYEAGTLNLHGIVGTCGALDGQAGRGLLGDEKQQLSGRLIQGLSELDDVTIHSPQDGTALCVSLSVAGCPAEELAIRLEREFGILGRPGLHCAPAAHQHLGTMPEGSMRLSPGWGNTIDDIDAVIRAVARLVRS